MLIQLVCLGRLKIFFRKTLLSMNSDDCYHSKSELYYPDEHGNHVEKCSRKRKHGRPARIETAIDEQPLFFLSQLDKKINTLFTV